MRIRLHASRLILSAALAAAAACQSCVGDVAAPAEEPADWIDIPIPPVVDLDANAIVSDRNGTLYLAGDHRAALWRSTDRGLTWTQKSIGLKPSLAVEDLLVKGGGTIFAALPGGGVFVSRDRGESWKQVNNHLTDIGTYSLCAAPGGAVLAGTYDGRIFRSENDGGVWVEAETDSIQDAVGSIVADPAGAVYAACRWQGIFCSADSGRTWARSSSGLEDLRVVSLAIDGEGYLLAGTWQQGIYRSAGAGEPWARIDGGALSGAAIREIAVDRSGTIYVGTRDHGVFRSPDGGDSWEEGNVGLRGLDVLSLLSAGDALIAGTRNEGAFRSTDGGMTWNPPRAYFPADPDLYAGYSSAYSITIDSCGAYYLINERSIVRSRNGGETWVRACSELPTYIRCLAILPNSSLIAGTSWGVYISTDSGDTWSRVDTSSSRPVDLGTVEVATNGVIFGRIYNGVVRSTDGGVFWKNIFSQETSVTSVSTGSGGRVYIGTQYAGVFGSTDDGDTWRRMTDSIGIWSIAADRVGNVFATSNDGILCSSDGGDTWKTVHLERRTSPHIASNSSYSVAAAPGGEVVVVYIDEGTLNISEDRFSSWKTVPVPYANSSIFLSPDGHLFISDRYGPSLHRSREALY